MSSNKHPKQQWNSADCKKISLEDQVTNCIAEGLEKTVFWHAGWMVSNLPDYQFIALSERIYQ